MEGTKFRPCSWWEKVITPEDKPIKYLEIGVHYGMNLWEIADTYCKHPDTEMHAIDPWVDYDEYDEYVGDQDKIYKQFLKNLDNASPEVKNKLKIHRGFSRDIIPTLEDDMFDIIFVDGNHEAEWALEDAVLSWRKLKSGGWMILDDYGPDPVNPTAGLQGFANGYRNVIDIDKSGIHDGQMFIKKK